MVFDPPLRPARLICRYKRFLADVMTAEGQTMTLHCANTGAMTGCGEPGDTLWYSTSHNPKRKYAHSWELTETRQNELICVNTLQANPLVEEALTLNRIPELSHYTDVQREVRYGHSTNSSRIDFLLRADSQPACYLEVKSVTLSQQGTGYFPDTVTTRGQKHLRELSAMAQAGHRAVLFFAILHSGITKVLPAKHIDPIYGQLLEQAIADGVEVFAYQASLSTSGISLCGSLPVSC